MLVPSRRRCEKFLLPGLMTVIQVLSFRPVAVRLGLESSADAESLRAEMAAPVADSTAAQLRQLVDRRLAVSEKGLAVLRRQLQAGATEDAAVTLANIAEDLRMLRQRLADETRTPAPQQARTASRENDGNDSEQRVLFLGAVGKDVAAAGDGAALDSDHWFHQPISPAPLIRYVQEGL
jgi:hypothetical protein